MARGHAEPRLAAARLGVAAGAGQRRPDRRQPAGRRRRGASSSPSSATACCSPASRCSCSRPCRPRCCRACRGSPRAARSPSSASGFRRLMTLVVAVGVVGTAGAFVLGPFVDRALSTTPSSAGAPWPCWRSAAPVYMVALAIAQAVIALHGHALVALGWTVGMVDLRRRHRGSSATSCSAGSSSACCVGSFAAMVVLRAGPAQSGCAPASCPTPGSMMERSPTCRFET